MSEITLQEHQRRAARAKWDALTPAERSAAGRHAVTLGLKRKKEKAKSAKDRRKGKNA